MSETIDNQKASDLDEKCRVLDSDSLIAIIGHVKTLGGDKKLLRAMKRYLLLALVREERNETGEKIS